MLRKTLPFQLEKSLPYALDEAVVKFIYPRRADLTRGVCLSVLREKLERDLLEWKEVDPEWVSCTPVALYRFVEFLGSEVDSYLIFHIEPQKIQIVSVIEKMIGDHLTLPIGSHHFFSSYTLDLIEKKGKSVELSPDFSFAEIGKGEFPHLLQTVRRFEREVDRARSFLKGKQRCPRHLLLLGEDRPPFFIEKSLLHSRAFSLVKLRGLPGYEAASIEPYAIPIGLSLDLLKNDRMSVQFRQGSFVAKGVIDKIKRRVVRGIFLPIAFFFALFFSIFFALQEGEKRLFQRLDRAASLFRNDSSLLHSVEKERDFTRKIALIGRELDENFDEENYFSPPPLLSNFLLHLSDHPQLRRGSGRDGIELKKLRYTLVDYPSLRSPSSSYKTKVEISLHFPKSIWAHEFYRSLVEGDPFVDPREEVTWNRDEEVDAFAFFLKR